MPAMRMRVALVLAALLAFAVGVPAVVAACSSPHDPGSTSNGPLSDGSGKDGRILSHGGECSPRTNGLREAFGISVFTNYGHATVVLDRVVLLHPRNERMIASDVIPGKRAYIGAEPWPPDYPSVRGAWKTRQPVHGYRVGPGESFNMVLGVEPAGPRNATSQGLLVYYHDPAGSYVAPSYFGMEIAPGSCG